LSGAAERGWLRRLADGVIDQPWPTLAVVAVVTLGAAAGLVNPLTGTMRLQLDPGIDRVLPDQDADRVFYDEMREKFGNDESIVMAVVADDVFTPAVLGSVARMTARIAKVDGVRRVTSLATALDVSSTDGELVIEPFLDTMPETPAELARLRAAVFKNPMYAGTLVSTDGRATALRVDLEPMNERELAGRGLDRTLRAIADEERGDATVWMTGAALVKVGTAEALVADLGVLIPAALGVAMLVALVAFRTLRGVMIPAATIMLGLLWTLGIVGWSGRPLNLVTTIVPPLILTVGFCYSVHVLSAYYEAARRKPGAGAREIVADAMEEVRVPCLLTALTTVIGFAALMVNSLVAVREFGAFSVIGVLATTLASLTVTPCLLAILPVPKRLGGSDEHGPIDRFLEGLARFDVGRRHLVFAVVAVVCLIAAYGTTKVRVGSDVIGNFAADAPIRRNFEGVNDSLGGATVFHVVLRSEERDAWKKPINLKRIDELQQWLAAQPLVGGVMSLVDHVKLLNWALHDEDPAHRVLPDSIELVDQLMFFGASEELDGVVDRQFRTTRLAVRTKTGDTGSLTQFLRDIDAKLATLPPGLSGRATGSIVLVSKTVDDVAGGQIQSLAIAFVSIFAVLAIMLASVRMGLLALLPNAVPVLVFFGTMGLAGIELSAVTGLVACIVLGVSVDDTIHYMTRFGALAREHADEQVATVLALKSVGRPVTYSAIALCGGFLTLTLSSLRNEADFGALSAFTLAAAWLFDLTLTPALCSQVRFVTLWDVLALDLGANPAGSIPLFAGLRQSQAKVVALMASFRTYAKGEALTRIGEGGDEVYVVVDGELLAWVERDGRVVELERLRRGAVVGEMVLFQGRRTANVDVLADARVLTLRRADLDRLRARYPRIAAIVYRNLGEVLAGRVKTTTERLSGQTPLTIVPETAVG